MSKQSDRVKKWRQTTKKRIIDSMGGQCQICGYNKCESALALHHINPEEKEISMGSIRANPRNWLSIVLELRKCVLLCHNCHSEVHSGLSQLPQNFSTFDENFMEYKSETIIEEDNCPICNKNKPVFRKYCSNVCSGKSSRKVNWDDINLEKLIQTNSIVSIAENLNVSETSVRKRLRKLGLR